MSRWVEDNPVGITLASVSGILVVVALLLGVVWSMPPSAPPPDPETEGSEMLLDVPQLAQNEPLDRYAVITDRPAFNQSRQPVLIDERVEAEEEEPEEEEVDTPEFELAGVIITPSIRMVTLKHKDKEKSLIAFEGQPLEGAYGSWHVSRIGPRDITLSSGDGTRTNLQMQIHDVAIQAPVRPKSDEGSTESEGGEESNSDQPLSRAEEIRQRIAERREELRQAAESEEESEAAPVNYRDAIQSMVSGGRKTKAKDQN